MMYGLQSGQIAHLSPLFSVYQMSLGLKPTGTNTHQAVAENNKKRKVKLAAA